MFDWLWNRLLSQKRIDAIVEKALPSVLAKTSAIAKETAFNLMEDEDIALAVTEYGDALFDRYMQKFYGSLGGKQKGLNYALDEVTGGGLDIFDEDGNPSIKKIIAMGAQKMLSGQFNKTQPPSRRLKKNPFQI